MRTFPVIERHRLLWIWPGDPAKADPASIPDFSFVESDATPIGHLSMQAQYELLTDNLMDLSHIEFVHTGTFGGGGVIFQGKHSVVEENGAVHSDWWMPDIAPPPWSRHQFAEDARVDHWLDMRWNAPASMRLVVGVAPAGTPRSRAPVLLAAHIVTPETERSTHYFFSDLPGPTPDESARHAFELEDRPLLEAVQQNMGDAEFWSLQPAMLTVDSGAVRVRRVLAELIRRERAEQQPAPGTSAR